MATNRSRSDRGAALPPRLRVLVRGASTTVNIGPTRESRAQGTFPERLERRLRSHGIDADVTNRSRMWDIVTDVFPRWFFELATENPDVVVLCFGTAEAQPKLLPRRFIGVLNRRQAIPPLGSVSGRIAAVADRRLRRLIARTCSFASHRLGMRTHRVSPRRFEAELERLIRWTRAKTRSLVLVVTIAPASPRVERLWARLNDRYAVYDRIIEDVVARLDDAEVRIINVRKIVADLGEQTAIYDGLHFTAVAHDALASAMCDEILPWLPALQEKEPE
ncbi:MAG: hypothetical protein E6G68_03900 [Actinobacteria bacterium]|nr:MAG: hypothetical protein E6G68_03900 [Actinomycetota bacterium]